MMALAAIWQKHRNFLIFLLAAFLSSLVLFYTWQITATTIENVTLDEGAVFGTNRQVKSPPWVAKGVYLTAYSAGSRRKIDEIIELIKKTELNAAVIDIKDYSGNVLYDSKIKLVDQLGIKDNRLGNAAKLIQKLHRAGIYVIARQTVFQDPILAEKKPEWAIKVKGGTASSTVARPLWRDRKGLAWVDPTKREVWNYNLAIAREAAALGFDEINFDYMRFPSDGNMSAVEYTNGQKKKYQVMREFYEFLSKGLADEPVWTSIDMFGFVMEKTGEDDMNIGQRLADAVDNFDYVCPMMYPSHYPSGHLGLANPAEDPATVLENGFKLGAHYFVGKRAQLRPWIQAFNMGAVYDAGKIRAQIDSAEANTKAGWLMWNAANRYSNAGLKIK